MPSINPAGARYNTSFGHHTAIPFAHFYDSIPDHYLDGPSVVKMISTDSNATNNNQIRLVTGSIKGKILYFSFSSFYLYALDHSVDPARMVIDTFLNRLRQLSPSIKGIILDLRSNNGGALLDMNFLMGNFISSPLVFGFTRSKNGTGRLDYTPWAPAIVKPLASFAIGIPVIVLADNHSVSMAEQTTMVVHSLPTGTIVGERTWGANGPLTGDVNYNDGQFYIGINAGDGNAGPNFNSFGFVFTSSVEFKYLDDHNYEGQGFPPDHPVLYNPQALQLGDDPQLDTAISLIH
jgi:carboxyl-terminal processing protease